MRTPDLIDAAAGERVLVFGSPPPSGRDLDVLVRPAAAAVIASALDREGFVAKGTEWVRFRDCTAEAVDLVSSSSWNLPPAEEEALFAEALPLPGFRQLVEPAAHHQLLILGRLGMSPKRRNRLERALGAPGAWELALERAPLWDGVDALGALRDPPRARPSVPVPRRGFTISLSGLDGAGKSTQAEALVATLRLLGRDAVVVWAPIGSPLLDLVGKPAKWILGRLRFGRFRGLAERSASGSVMSTGTGEGGLRIAWAAFVAFASGLEQRRAAAPHLLRGRVVVYDRHALDAVVRLRVLYGNAGGSKAIRTLLRLAAPPPRLAWFLDIRPETSIARKDDIWTLEQLAHHRDLYLEELPRHGVLRLDGEAPRADICAELAETAWRALD